MVNADTIVFVTLVSILVQKSHSHEMTVSVGEGSMRILRCPANYGIVIESAIFRIQTTGFCDISVTDAVTYQCEGYQECTIEPELAYLTNGNNWQCDNVRLADIIWIGLIVDHYCELCEDNRRKRRMNRTCSKDLCDKTHGYTGLRINHSEGRCNVRYTYPKRETACPNARFLVKHVSQGRTKGQKAIEELAVEVAYIRDFVNATRTSFNSIFEYDHMTYRQNGTLCVFNDFAAKFNCQYHPNNVWACEPRGEVIAVHDMVSGHYYHKMDEPKTSKGHHVQGRKVGRE